MSKKGETSSYSIDVLAAEYSDVLVLGESNEEMGRQELVKSTMGKGGTLWLSIDRVAPGRVMRRCKGRWVGSNYTRDLWCQ